MAKDADLGAVVEIQHSDPAPELIGLAGDVERARRLGRALTISDGILDPKRPVVVLESAAKPIAFLQYSVGPSASGALSAPLVVRTVAALGSGVVGLPRRLAARRAIRLAAPAGSLYIAELHVHPEHRGRGFGGQLLAWSSQHCRVLGLGQRSLITGSENPAIRLYERAGFEIVERATDARYQQVFGEAGRVLMVACP
ncbi:MAG: GNAT family N-acetyltransferase [Actinomycetota bacterium]